MPKVYIVTAGEYSDYHIIECFTDKNLANQFKDQYSTHEGYKYDKAEVEEFNLDRPADQWDVIYVRMTKEGVVRETYSSFDGDIGIVTWDVEGSLLYGVATSEPNQAIRVANAARIQLIASGEWKGDSND